MTRVAVIGSNGQVGRELVRTLSREHTVVAMDRNVLDLSNPRITVNSDLFAGLDLVVNAAAYTAVDKAEDEPDVAAAVNATGAGLVAEAAAQASIPIVHFSTDYVFDGTKQQAYVESDATGPLGVYGLTKLEGERLVAIANPRHVILRTAWVFSPHGHNFVKTMLRLARERPRLRVIDDQRGNPTSAADLAAAVARLVPRMLCSGSLDRSYGVFHAVNGGTTTWYSFARSIMEGAQLRGAPAVPVDPIPTSEYATKVARPVSSVLATDKLASVYDIRMRPWPEALANCLDDLLGPESIREPGCLGEAV